MTSAIVTDIRNPRTRLAAEIRGELAKRQIKVTHLGDLLGNSREYWRSRITSATVPLDIDDLGKLAGLMGMRIPEFFGVPPQGPTPSGPGTPSELGEEITVRLPASEGNVTHVDFAAPLAA